MEHQAVTKATSPSTQSHSLQKQGVKTPAANNQIVSLQQAIGNQALQRLLRSRYIQAKLQVGPPNDHYEQEADRVADTVMRMPDPQYSSPATVSNRTYISRLYRKCTECEEEKVSLQSIEGGEEEPEATEAVVQRVAESGSAVAETPAGIESRLAATHTGGEPLGFRTRHQMETAFGRDFSRVRVHRDSQAAEISHKLSAHAFTHGRHIYFGSGNYQPEGSSGKRLLAHELTHIAQQGHAPLKSGGAASPTPAAVQMAPLAIQRVATWAAPAPNETNNLANTAITGVPVGVTAPTFNGVQFGALNEPTVTVSAVASGGFDATVATVPANTGSVNETVLGPGPWRRVTPRATIGALFPGLAQCTGAGNSNFRARGAPSDAAMFAASRRHEDRHARDRRDAFNASVVPWDARLTAANTAGTTHHGATAADARTALFTAMGGTGVQVQAACLAAGAAARDAYHATPGGGPVAGPTDPTAAPDCSWSFARYTNPS